MTLTTELSAVFNKPLKKLTPRQLDLVMFHIKGWAKMTPMQRRSRATMVDSQRTTLARLKLARYERKAREGAGMPDDEFIKGFETACQLDDAKNELARVSVYRSTDPVEIDLQRKQISDAQAEVTRLTEALNPPKPPAPEAAQVSPVTESAPETPWHLLATPVVLIAAFGLHTGMSAAWFNHVESTPGLLAARVHKGQGGKHFREPFYSVMMVLAWLTDPKRRKGKPIQTDTAWRILKTKFNLVYLEYKDQEPDPYSPG